MRRATQQAVAEAVQWASRGAVCVALPCAAASLLGDDAGAVALACAGALAGALTSVTEVPSRRRLAVWCAALAAIWTLSSPAALAGDDPPQTAQEER